MDHYKMVKQQILHLFFGAVFFLIIGAFAVALDLTSGYVASLGVSSFTAHALEFSAHAILLLDLVLFFIYLIVTSFELVKGMLK